MDVLLSYESALEALRHSELRDAVIRAPRVEPLVPARVPSARELATLVKADQVLSRLTVPLDLLVSGGRARTRTTLATAHLQSSPLPPGSILRLSRSALCVAPELLAVQMATRLTRLELVVLLSELMGLYATDPSCEDGMTQRDFPLTTPAAVLGYLDALGPRPGTRAVRRALASACVSSGSPRETKLSLRLALKPALGGQNLYVLSMNEPLEVRRIGNRLRAGVRKPDVLIGRRDEAGRTGKRHVVALEYHGRHHDKPAQLARDADRTNELKAIGIGEYVIRREQYRDLPYMLGIADAIRRELGEPAPHLTREQRAQRNERSLGLYRELERIDGVHWTGRAREAQETRKATASQRVPWPDESVPLEAYGLD